MKTYAHPDLAEISLPTALQALSDPCRLAILRAMVTGGKAEYTCGEIELPVGKATASHHFEALRAAGLIRTRVEGNRCLSSLRREEFEARFPGLLALVETEPVGA